MTKLIDIFGLVFRNTMCLANHNRSNLLRQSTSSLKSASPIEDLSDDVDWRSKMNSVFFGDCDDVDWQSAEEEENF